MAKIIKLRPAVPARPTRPGPAPDGPVSVEWDEGRGMHVAVCRCCMEWLFTECFEQAHTWGDEHRCDPELVGLLAEVLDRWAA